MLVVCVLIECFDKLLIGVCNLLGFVVNWILVLMINEVFFVLVEGIVLVEEIDVGMKFGVNYLIGLFVLVDFVGFDVCFVVMDVFVKDFGDLKYCVCLLLCEMVLVGWFGCKIGCGVYDYSK